MRREQKRKGNLREPVTHMMLSASDFERVVHEIVAILKDSSDADSTARSVDAMVEIFLGSHTTSASESDLLTGPQRRFASTPKRLCNDTVGTRMANTAGERDQLLLTRLTPHQLRTLRLLEDGLSGKCIAAKLGISIHTVNYHKRNLYRNLNVSSATEAIRRGRESGLI